MENYDKLKNIISSVLGYKQFVWMDSVSEITFWWF